MTDAALAIGGNWLDYLALIFFAGGWFAYAKAADNYKNPQRPSLLTVMHRFREKWMITMQLRALRMPDTMILSIATGNYTFFASTSILIIAGAFTLLLRDNEWQALLNNIPFHAPASDGVIQLKLIILIMVFVYSFFKFTWSIRQVSYCAIVIGGIRNYHGADAGGGGEPSRQDIILAQSRAQSLAPLFTLAGNNFNYGLRAYYFGLALLPWFIGPVWLFCSVSATLYILWQREFNSKTLSLLLRAETELDSAREAAANAAAQADAQLGAGGAWNDAGDTQNKAGNTGAAQNNAGAASANTPPRAKVTAN